MQPASFTGYTVRSQVGVKCFVLPSKQEEAYGWLCNAPDLNPNFYHWSIGNSCYHIIHMIAHVDCDASVAAKSLQRKSGSCQVRLRELTPLFNVVIATSWQTIYTTIQYVQEKNGKRRILGLYILARSLLWYLCCCSMCHPLL